MASRLHIQRLQDTEPILRQALTRLSTVARRGGRPIVEICKRLKWRLLPYRPRTTYASDWEAQYSRGLCDYYRDISELARYSIVAGYCHSLKPAGAILDLGCGEGVLQERLYPDHYTRYVGVDFSGEAIGRAVEKRDQKTHFEIADIRTYVPNEQFDVIIFSECMMCFAQPETILKRYEAFLKDDGIFIVSLNIHDSTFQVWKLLEKSYRPQDEVVVSHKGTKLSWIIKIYRALSYQNTQQAVLYEKSAPI